MTHSPRVDPRPDPPPAVTVDVARSGGIAGMTRRWSAQPADAEASEWISLIDRCPWDDADTSSAAAPDEGPDARPQATSAREGAHAAVPDGFTWRIRAARSGTDPREAELVDADLVGAWRELVDAVREWNRGTAR